MSSGHVDPVALDALAGEARADAIRHLGGCAACRARLAAAAPESLFALLSLEPEPPALLDEVAAGVARRLDEGRPSRIEALRELGLPRPAAALVAAAAVLLAAVLVARPPRPAAVPVAAAAAATRADVTLVEPAPEARLIDLTVGGTQVVMIFDPELKL